MPAKKKADEKPKVAPKPVVYDYFDFRLQLIRDMLGPLPSASIWEPHILENAKKKIEQANALKGRMTKSLENYRGTEIPEEKIILQMHGIINAFAGLVGKVYTNLPNNLAELEIISHEIDSEFKKMVKNRERLDATVFERMRMGSIGLKPGEGQTIDTMWPVISGHMLIGNMKEIGRNMFSWGDKSIFPFKNTVGPIMAMCVKPVEEYMVPDHDIIRVTDDDELQEIIVKYGHKHELLKKGIKSKRNILERPIRVPDPKNRGEMKSAINMAELLPKGTKMGCVLRVMKDSPITEAALHRLLGVSKQNGLGPWRGSGHKGAFVYQLKKLRGFKDPSIPEGWL